MNADRPTIVELAHSRNVEPRRIFPGMGNDARRGAAGTAALAMLTGVGRAAVVDAGDCLGVIRMAVVGDDGTAPDLPRTINVAATAAAAWNTAADAAAVARRASENGLQVLVVEATELFHVLVADHRITPHEARYLGRSAEAEGRIVALAEHGVVTTVPWGEDFGLGHPTTADAHRISVAYLPRRDTQPNPTAGSEAPPSA